MTNRYQIGIALIKEMIAREGTGNIAHIVNNLATPIMAAIDCPDEAPFADKAIGLINDYIMLVLAHPDFALAERGHGFFDTEKREDLRSPYRYVAHAKTHFNNL